MTLEPRKKKLKKDSRQVVQREARRKERLKYETSAPGKVVKWTAQHPVDNKHSQNRLIIDLAWKTIALMHRNTIIQQKIVALQKETTEFVSAMMSTPENRQQYLESIYICPVAQLKEEFATNMSLKHELKPAL